MAPEQVLQNHSASYFGSLIARGWLAVGPDEARAKIALVCGSVPDMFGRNCPPFANLRAALCAAMHEVGLVNAVQITAPHTHWEPGPIVYRALSRHSFEVGPLAAHGGLSDLLPVSFIVDPSGELLPIEWCEAYPDLTGPDYETTVSTLARFARHAQTGLHATLSCFGLALNHRFKLLREPAIFATMEAPRPGQALSLVYIDTQRDYEDLEASNQVAWLARPFPELDASTMVVFQRINGLVAKLPTDVAQRVHASVRDKLRRG